MMSNEQIKAKVDQLYFHTFGRLLDEGEETPHEIIKPYLYLGSMADAYNIDKLVEKNITNVVNVADPSQEEGKGSSAFSGAVIYFPHQKRIKVNYLGLCAYLFNSLAKTRHNSKLNEGCVDIDDFQIRPFFDRVSDFIKAAKLKGEKVLVHCQAGVSRSAAVVCAYLIREYGWTAEKALLHTHQKRKCVSPNLGFMKQLFLYQNELGIKVTEELFTKPAPSINIDY